MKIYDPVLNIFKIHVFLFFYYTDVEFVPGGDFYYPVIYFNDYWNLNTDYQPVNDTVK